MAEKKSLVSKTAEKPTRAKKSIAKKVEDAEVVAVAETVSEPATKKVSKPKAAKPKEDAVTITKFVIANINGSQEYLYEGMKLDVLRIEGEKYETAEVLMTVDGEKVVFGKPYVSGASVEMKKVEDYRGKKVRTMTYKAKSRYRKIRGSRPSLSTFEVTKLNF